MVVVSAFVAVCLGAYVYQPHFVYCLLILESALPSLSSCGVADLVISLVF
jgi:hypothetical protein